MYGSMEQYFTDKESRGILTSYGSVLALHQSRSICLTFLTLGAVEEGEVGAVAAAGPALLKIRNKDTLDVQKVFMHKTIFSFLFFF